MRQDHRYQEIFDHAAIEPIFGMGIASELARHGYRFYEALPVATHLLGLPRGYRFLLAGDYFDVWYDEKLLDV